MPVIGSASRVLEQLGLFAADRVIGVPASTQFRRYFVKRSGFIPSRPGSMLHYGGTVLLLRINALIEMVLLSYMLNAIRRRKVICHFDQDDGFMDSYLI